MQDDATPTPGPGPGTDRRPVPTGPRSAGLRVVPPPALAPVIRLSPRTGRSDRPVRADGHPSSPVLVVLPDPAPVVDLVERATRVELPADEAPLSIQDRIRLRALESADRLH